MKRGLIIALIIILIGVVILLFTNNTQEDQSEKCIPSGEISKGINLKPEYTNLNCCEGLKSIKNKAYYGECVDAGQEECYFSQENEEICSDCGNGICDLKENWCNCKEDCGGETGPRIIEMENKCGKETKLSPEYIINLTRNNYEEPTEKDGWKISSDLNSRNECIWSIEYYESICADDYGGAVMLLFSVNDETGEMPLYLKE